MSSSTEPVTRSIDSPGRPGGEHTAGVGQQQAAMIGGAGEGPARHGPFRQGQGQSVGVIAQQVEQADLQDLVEFTQRQQFDVVERTDDRTVDDDIVGPLAAQHGAMPGEQMGDSADSACSWPNFSCPTQGTANGWTGKVPNETIDRHDGLGR